MTWQVAYQDDTKVYRRLNQNHVDVGRHLTRTFRNSFLNRIIYANGSWYSCFNGFLCQEFLRKSPHLLTLPLKLSPLPPHSKTMVMTKVRISCNITTSRSTSKSMIYRSSQLSIARLCLPFKSELQTLTERERPSGEQGTDGT